MGEIKLRPGMNSLHKLLSSSRRFPEKICQVSFLNADQNKKARNCCCMLFQYINGSITILLQTCWTRVAPVSNISWWCMGHMRRDSGNTDFIPGCMKPQYLQTLWWHYGPHVMGSWEHWFIPDCLNPNICRLCDDITCHMRQASGTSDFIPGCINPNMCKSCGDISGHMRRAPWNTDFIPGCMKLQYVQTLFTT